MFDSKINKINKLKQIKSDTTYVKEAGIIKAETESF
jgi:hypothetical protein